MVCRPAIRIEILNKEETMENTIIITNSHPHGFCFACDTVSNEQVFIPIHVAEGYTLKPGDRIKALLVPTSQRVERRGRRCVYIAEKMCLLIKLKLEMEMMI